jgi:hypothetical protein
MNLSSIGIEVTNPEQTVEIEATSFGEFCLLLHSHAANLELVARVMELENPGGANQRLLSSQQALTNMANGMRGALHEHLRIAREQGLQFKIAGEQRTSH